LSFGRVLQGLKPIELHCSYVAAEAATHKAVCMLMICARWQPRKAGQDTGDMKDVWGNSWIIATHVKDVAF